MFFCCVMEVFDKGTKCKTLRLSLMGASMFFCCVMEVFDKGIKCKALRLRLMGAY